ncbi:MAG: ABC transporter permease, partial [Bdellovibrionales bacterium]|nr:ABC transporter permease [Bdellovibrionales bacterium]
WIKGFFRSWQQQPAMQVATLSVLVGTFVVISIFLLVHRNLDRILTNWGDSVRMSVFLQDEVDSEQISKTKSYLQGLGKFKEIKFISKNDAAQLFSNQMGSLSPDFLKDPEFGNPLPPSFEASLDKTTPIEERLDTMVKLATQIRKLPLVEDLYYGQGWVENYGAVVKSFTLTSGILTLVLLIGSLFVVGNSIRNAISQRREEIEILELVGATPEMIRIPYVVEGTMMGLLSGLIAIFLVWSLFTLQNSVLNYQIGFLNIGKYFGFLGFSEVFLLLSLSSSFGAIGAFFCVRKICNGWSASRGQGFSY